MKGLKRVFALAVVFAMILSCVPAMAATNFVDVSEDDAVVVDVLTSLDIIQGYDENGTMYFKGDNTITRAEFAAVVTRLLGMEDSAKTQRDTIFTDVPASHWASGYITTAVDTNGIIVGMGDGTFQPESPVTYEQAVKMLVCALGYETKALEEGTYPTGYIFVAKTIGLLDDVVGSVGQEAKRSTVAQLLYNALDVPLMQRILSGTTKSYYGVYDGEEYSPRKTVMSEYLNVVKLVGEVTKNEISTGGRAGIVSIKIADNFGTRFAATNSIYKVGETTDFEVGETNAKDFMGYEVLAFATYTSSRTTDPTILAIQDNSKSGTKFSVDLDMIKEVTATDSVVTITYYVDDAQSKTSKLYVASDVDDLTVFFNGINESAYSGHDFADDFTRYDMDELNGTLEVRSTKSDGAYDYNVMSFTIYKTFVVESVIGDPTYRVYPIDDFNYDGLSYIPFDPDDKDVTTTIVDEDGNSIDPETLESWDVLSVKYNDPLNKTDVLTSDKTVFDCVLVQDSIDGAVTEVSTTSNRIVVDGTEYKLSNSAVADDIDLGDSGVFYLDGNGKIVAFDKSGTKANNYGIILATGSSSGTTVSDYSQVKMYTPDGSLSVYDLADKVRINNGSSQTATDALAVINAKAKPLVVTYSTNGAGDINKISFAPNSPGTSAINYNQNLYKNNDIYANVEGIDQNLEILAANRAYPTIRAGRQYQMNEATKVIVFDQVASTLKAVSASEFESYVGTDFTADIDIDDAEVSVYNVNSNNYAGLVFIVGSLEDSDEATGLALVRSINMVTNSEGSDVSKYSTITTAAEGFESFVEGENFSLIIPSGKNFAVGSIMIPGTVDANGEIRKATALTYKEGNFYLPNMEYFSNWADKVQDNKSDVTYYFGKVTNKSGSSIRIDNELAAKNGNILPNAVEEYLTIPTSKVALVYDERKSSPHRVFVNTAGVIGSFVRDNKNPDGTSKEWDGTSYVPAEDVTYYIFVKEYNGTIQDVVIYIYNGDVTINLSSIDTVVVDSVAADEQDIIVED